MNGKGICMTSVKLGNDVSMSPVVLGFWRFMEHNTTKEEF